MSGQLTQAGANRAVQAGVGQAQSASSAMYLMLLTALPSTPITDTLSTYNATELATSGYARQAVTWSSPSGSPSTISNAAQITWTFTGDPAAVQYIALCDAASGTSGSVLAYWTATASVDVGAGGSIVINAAGLSISVAG